MTVRHVLLCFFLITAQVDGITSPFHQDIGEHRGTRGGDITVSCTFKVSGVRQLFCQNDCENGKILVETTGLSGQKGRYRIKYEESLKILKVSITNLQMTDSGKYTCGMERDWFLDSTVTFELGVEDKTTTATSKPTWTPRPSTSTLTTWWSSSSITGSTTPSAHSPETKQTSASDSSLPLYLGLTLLLLVLILSAILFGFCQKRDRKPKRPPSQAEYADTHNVNRVYEEIREDRPKRPPQTNVSTVYACTTYVKPNEAEATDEYSLITMAASQNKTEKDSSNLTYSEVDFSKSQAASPHSAPFGEADKVIYSEPRVGVDSDDRKTPLYSTVSLH